MQKNRRRSKGGVSSSFLSSIFSCDSYIFYTNILLTYLPGPALASLGSRGTLLPHRDTGEHTDGGPPDVFRSGTNGTISGEGAGGGLGTPPREQTNSS